MLGYFTTPSASIRKVFLLNLELQPKVVILFRIVIGLESITKYYKAEVAVLLGLQVTDGNMISGVFLLLRQVTEGSYSVISRAFYSYASNVLHVCQNLNNCHMIHAIGFSVFNRKRP